jgi:hypothetical protein
MVRPRSLSFFTFELLALYFALRTLCFVFLLLPSAYCPRVLTSLPRPTSGRQTVDPYAGNQQSH